MNNTAMKNKLVSTLFALFIGVASLRTVGQITGLQQLEGLGFISGFSPLPNVFSDKEGYEDFTTEIDFHYTSRNGETKTKRLDNQAFQQISGPLYWRGLLGVSLGYAYRFPEEYWLRSWRYMFCQSNLLYKILPEYQSRYGMEVSIRVQKNSRPTHFRKKLECE